MSEEKLDRIEAQISELREMMVQNMHDMTVMKEDMTVMKQDITATKQNVNALSEDVISLRNRVDSIEGTVAIAIKEGFESMRNYDLANNDPETRRLSRRVARLEKDD